jgi:hypothetical protein
MSDHLAINLPFERGQQLRDLAAEKGLTITDTVGLLIDHAAANGLGTPALPGFDITATGGAVHIKFDAYVLTLSAADARSVAQSLRAVAIRGGVHLNMDLPETVEITRKGTAVVITIHGERRAMVKKTISCGVARAVADRLEEAAGAIVPIRELLGDLEEGAPAYGA